jgi:hypothetical protein
VLAADGARDDPRIVAALEHAISTARGKPYGSGASEAIEAARCLWLSQSPPFCWQSSASFRHRLGMTARLHPSIDFLFVAGIPRLQREQ